MYFNLILFPIFWWSDAEDILCLMATLASSFVNYCLSSCHVLIVYFFPNECMLYIKDICLLLNMNSKIPSPTLWLNFSFLVVSFFFLTSGHTCSIWKFQSQWLNHSHCKSNAMCYVVSYKGSPSFLLVSFVEHKLLI